MKYFIALFIFYGMFVGGLIYYLVENKDIVERIIKGKKDEDR